MEGGKTREPSADEGAEEDRDYDEVGESTITSFLPDTRMRETRRCLKEIEENLPKSSKMVAKATTPVDEGAEEDGARDEVGELTITSYLLDTWMRETSRCLKEKEENLPKSSKMAAKATILTSFRLVLKNGLHVFIRKDATPRRANSDDSTVDRSLIPEALSKADTFNP